MDSILTSVKKMLGIEEEYTHFDADIIMFINSVLMTLEQMGVGPESTLFIENAKTCWSDLIGDRTDLASVKIYVYMKVKLMFDPPTSSYVLDAIERQIKEHEWRIMAQAEKGAAVV